MAIKFLKAIAGMLLQILSFISIILLVDFFIFPVKSSLNTLPGSLVLFSGFFSLEIIGTLYYEVGLENSKFLKAFFNIYMFKEREELGLVSSILMGTLVLILIFIIDKVYL